MLCKNCGHALDDHSNSTKKLMCQHPKCQIPTGESRCQNFGRDEPNLQKLK